MNTGSPVLQADSLPTEPYSKIKCFESPSWKYFGKVKLFRDLPETVEKASPRSETEFDSESNFIVLGLLELEGRKKMSPLLRSIFNITKIFNQYASHDCDGTTLSKKDLKNLLEREFGDILRVRNNKKRKFLYWFRAMKFFLRRDQGKEWWLYIHLLPWQFYTIFPIHFWVWR